MRTVTFDINRAVLLNDHCLDTVAFKLVADFFCCLHIFTFCGNDKCILVLLHLILLELPVELIEDCICEAERKPMDCSKSEVFV